MLQLVNENYGLTDKSEKEAVTAYKGVYKSVYLTKRS